MLSPKLKRSKILTKSVSKQGRDPLLGRNITMPLFCQQQCGMMSDTGGVFDTDFEHQYKYNNDELE